MRDSVLLSRADMGSVLNCVAALNARIDFEDFPAHAVRMVAQVVAADVYCYTDINVHRVVNYSHPADDYLEQLIPVLQELSHQHPLVRRAQDGDTRTACVSEVISAREWDQLEVNQHFYRLLGVRDQMCVFLPTAPTWITGIALNRSRRGFSARDHAMLNLLRPHIVQAYRNAAVVSALKENVQLLHTELESVGQAGQGDQGVLTIDFDGRIRSCSREAGRLLSEYFDAWRRVPERLPDEVFRWNLRQREGANAVPPTPREPLVVPGERGRLMLRLIPDDQEQRWLIVLREERNLVADDVPPEAQKLSPRLRSVLTCLLAGDSAKQVAWKLQISHHTARDYIKELYRRFNVSSRGELLARWVRR